MIRTGAKPAKLRFTLALLIQWNNTNVKEVLAKYFEELTEDFEYFRGEGENERLLGKRAMTKAEKEKKPLEEFEKIMSRKSRPLRDCGLFSVVKPGKREEFFSRSYYYSLLTVAEAHEIVTDFIAKKSAEQNIIWEDFLRKYLDGRFKSDEEPYDLFYSQLVEVSREL